MGEITLSKDQLLSLINEAYGKGCESQRISDSISFSAGIPARSTRLLDVASLYNKVLKKISMTEGTGGG